jgi:hypothetical protein
MPGVEVVRYASMLKKTITKVECDCEFDTHVDGSVLRGDVVASVTESRAHLRIASPEPDELPGPCKVLAYAAPLLGHRGVSAEYPSIEALTLR